MRAPLGEAKGESIPERQLRTGTRSGSRRDTAARRVGRQRLSASCGIDAFHRWGTPA